MKNKREVEIYMQHHDILDMVKGMTQAIKLNHVGFDSIEENPYFVDQVRKEMKLKGVLDEK